MAHAEGYQTRHVEILHSCLRRGVHVRLHLDRPLDIESLRDVAGYDVHVVDSMGHGSFRVTIDGVVAVTGVLGGTAVTSMFMYFRKEEALRSLDRVFGGARSAYEIGLESAV